MATQDRFGVGVVGLGNSGWHYHAADSIPNSSDFDVVAVCSHRPERAKAAGEAFEARAYTEWTELLADPGVDVVVVALPHHLHLPAVVAAAGAGKHIVVEKPMAMTVAEADAMIEAAQANDVTLTVFQQRRWEADAAKIREAVASGAIGELWRVEVCRSHRGPYAVVGADSPHTGQEPLAWAHSREQGGGVSLLIAPHLVDHILHLVGTAPRDVAGRQHVLDGDDVEHHMQIDLGFDNGVQGRVEVFREFGMAPRWAVYGTEGTIVSADGSEVVIRRRDAEPEVFGGLPAVRGCAPFYDALGAALRSGGPPPVTAEEGRRVVQVLELAATSAGRAGALLSWPTPAQPSAESPAQPTTGQE